MSIIKLQSIITTTEILLYFSRQRVADFTLAKSEPFTDFIKFING